MAWIESHQSLGSHLKLRRMARELGVCRAQAVGHLHYLWWWSIDNAPKGDVSGLSAVELSEVCEWQGEPEKLESALRSCGWIDDDGHLHDWNDYAGRLVSIRDGNRDRQRKSRERHALRNGPSRVTNANASQSVTGHQTQPDPTNQTQPTKTKTETEPRRKADACASLEAEIVRIYDAYPRKASRPDAMRAIGKALKKIPADNLLAKVQAFSEAYMASGNDPQFIPYPATWFNAEGWNDPLPAPFSARNGQDPKPFQSRMREFEVQEVINIPRL